MSRNRTALLLAAAVALIGSSKVLGQAAAAPGAAGGTPALQWATPTAENRLWTRWWWMGNAVDEKNLTHILEQFHDAGMGGVEICPIYGAYGAENRYLDFLSPKWMTMLAHTVRETKRLGMETDMTTGTGWPFGGSMVPDADASKGIVLKEFDHYPAATELAAGKLVCVMAYPAGGQPQDVTGKVGATMPAGTKYLAGVQVGPQQKVKRAAPNAEGNVLDPYSVASLNNYLGVFDKAFVGYEKDFPRSQFHDSFEYYDATWTANMFDEFQKRRGYDLRTQLAALNNQGPADVVARVKCDYRETLSDLHLEYMNRWVAWSHAHGGIARNQAHGGPGNILDVYANADIAECEIFHVYEESHLPFLKLSSSAAHVTGHKYCSSESFTWLDEHFNASLAEVKPAADFLILLGVNHMFLHGIPYSPEDAAWPGWNFYASVNFGPNGGLWRDFPAFTSYVARVQSVMQAGKPGNDVLVYMPFYEFWSDPANNDKLMLQFTTPGLWMKPYKIYEMANLLSAKGVSYDEVSDKLLAGAKVVDGNILLGDGVYKELVLPETPMMQVETLKKVVALAQDGATVVVQGALPADVPGNGNLEARRAELKRIEAGLSFTQGKATVGKGSITVSGGGAQSADATLRLVTARVPAFAAEGLREIRRVTPEGADYFIANPSAKAFEGWAPIGPAASAVILDPRYANRIGVAKVSKSPEGVYLQLAAGESCIVRTFANRVVQGPAWAYTKPGTAMPLTGTWNVSFIDGGPVLPKAFSTGKTGSWTVQGDEEAKRFAGTAKYTLAFDKPAGAADDYALDLGKVGDSARVTLNGQSLGTLWAAPFSINLGAALKAGRNTLEIEVTNVAANRIADMDRRGVQWKIFRDANVLSTAYTKFDASNWPVRDAGLIGPVQLTPLTKFVPQ